MRWIPSGSKGVLPVVVVSLEMGIPIAGVLEVFGGLSVAVCARRRARRW